MENNKSQDIIEITTTETSCHGDENSKHPKIYLKINSETKTVVCPYCSKQFIYKEER